MCPHLPIKALFALLSLLIVHSPLAQSFLNYQKLQRLNDSKKTSSKSQDRLKFHMDKNYYFQTSSFEIDTSMEFYLDSHSINYSLGEGYYFFSYYDHNFSIGRKILEWNPNEKFWGDTHLNSKRNFTLLDQKREGLVGLHHSSQVGNFAYDIFFSYLHIPTMNPRIKIKDGKVSSRSDWVVLPPSKTSIINDVEVPIRYYSNENIADTIFKKSLGVRGTYHWKMMGQESYPGYASVYGLYKTRKLPAYQCRGLL